jgi:hypothetical protein
VGAHREGLHEGDLQLDAGGRADAGHGDCSQGAVAAHQARWHGVGVRQAHDGRVHAGEHTLTPGKGVCLLLH